MDAIITTYRGPTNSRGSRLTVRAGDRRRATVAWDHALDSEENHRRAAAEFLSRVVTPHYVRGMRIVAGAPIKPGQWAWIAEAVMHDLPGRPVNWEQIVADAVGDA